MPKITSPTSDEADLRREATVPKTKYFTSIENKLIEASPEQWMILETDNSPPRGGAHTKFL